MTRLGLNLDEAEKAFEILHESNELNYEGLYSHFATADEGDLSYAYEQVKKFKEILIKADSFGLNFKTIHFSNSGAVLNLNQDDFNLVRVGMLIYGAYPSREVPKDISISPVMEFKAPIVEVRRVKRGRISVMEEFTRRIKSAILVWCNAVLQTAYLDHGIKMGLSVTKVSIIKLQEGYVWINLW